MPSLLDSVRHRSRAVAEAASSVRIHRSAIPRYAASLPAAHLILPQMDPAIHYLGHGRDTITFFFVLDAVNFGSGYFPGIFNDLRRSGYRTVAAALASYFASHGPLKPEELSRLTPDDCAGIFGIEPATPPARELMGHFARAVNDLGSFLLERFDGDPRAVVEECGGSAERLVEVVSRMPLFRDVALYGTSLIPFYKRAQLLAVDLFIACGGEGAGRFHDLDRLTICADNLVPHVLRLDGILKYDEDLERKIEAAEEIPASSPEEVEIRACAVHAGELIVEELKAQRGEATALMLDNLLWHRGQQETYRVRPRHRTRTVFY